MKFDVPLSNLIDRCQTACVPECCGIDAYDFSPVHIASYLLMWRSDLDEKEVNDLREQLHSLKINYGVKGASGPGFVSEQMNQSFTGEQAEAFVSELLFNLDVAIDLVRIAQQKRCLKAE